MLPAVVNQNQFKKDDISSKMANPAAAVLAKLMLNTPLLVHTQPVVTSTMLANAPLATNRPNPNKDRKINFARVDI